MYKISSIIFKNEFFSKLFLYNKNSYALDVALYFETMDKMQLMLLATSAALLGVICSYIIGFVCRIIFKKFMSDKASSIYKGEIFFKKYKMILCLVSVPFIGGFISFLAGFFISRIKIVMLLSLLSITLFNCFRIMELF